jgi:hypothetical protein
VIGEGVGFTVGAVVGVSSFVVIAGKVVSVIVVGVFMISFVVAGILVHHHEHEARKHAHAKVRKSFFIRNGEEYKNNYKNNQIFTILHLFTFQSSLFFDWFHYAHLRIYNSLISCFFIAEKICLIESKRTVIADIFSLEC